MIKQDQILITTQGLVKVMIMCALDAIIFGLFLRNSFRPSEILIMWRLFGSLFIRILMWNLEIKLLKKISLCIHHYMYGTINTLKACSALPMANDASPGLGTRSTYGGAKGWARKGLPAARQQTVLKLPSTMTRRNYVDPLAVFKSAGDKIH